MVEGVHEHQPVVVVDRVREDGDGRPASWLYHVECVGCGVDLPDVEVEVDADLLADRRFRAQVGS